MTQADSIAVHGHDVIDQVTQHPDGLPIVELQQWIDHSFGAGATFYTCSADGMDLPTLLEFLQQREKVRVQGDLVYPGDSPACSH